MLSYPRIQHRNMTYTSLGGTNRWHALSYSDDFDNSDNFDMIEDIDDSGNTDRLGKL